MSALGLRLSSSHHAASMFVCSGTGVGDDAPCLAVVVELMAAIVVAGKLRVAVTNAAAAAAVLGTTGCLNLWLWSPPQLRSGGGCSRAICEHLCSPQRWFRLRFSNVRLIHSERDFWEARADPADPYV